MACANPIEGTRSNSTPAHVRNGGWIGIGQPSLVTTRYAAENSQYRAPALTDGANVI
ncbi:hypothetical protein D3C81_2023070 [compost metagenome]